MAYIKKFYRQNEGLTFVEVLIALSLLGVVLLLGYSFFFFGSNTFAKGESRSNMQRDIRQTAAFFTSEVRYATEIELVNTPTPTTGDGYNYISVENSRIKYTDPAGNVTYKTNAVITELTPMFTLTLENDRNLLQFRLEGTIGSQTYELETKALLYNVRGQAGASNQGFKYKKP